MLELINNAKLDPDSSLGMYIYNGLVWSKITSHKTIVYESRQVGKICVRA